MLRRQLAFPWPSDLVLWDVLLCLSLAEKLSLPLDRVRGFDSLRSLFLKFIQP
jgi:hypothetical protein